MPSKKRLLSHSDYHEFPKKGSKKGRYTCEDCGKSLASSSGLDAHIKTVHGQKIYDCEYCEKAFARKDHLFNHKKSIHTGLKYCIQCKQTFTGREGLADHIRLHHPMTVQRQQNQQHTQPTSSFACDICEKSFCSKYKLKQHTKAGHVVQQCSICKDTFIDHERLMNHMRSKHRDIKNADGIIVYKCIYCSGTFTLESSLDQHIQAFHAEQRCLICGANFIGAQNIARHIRESHPPTRKKINDNNITFHCDTCGKAFALKNQFEDHVLQKHTWSSVTVAKVHRTFDSISPVKKKRESSVALYQCEYCDELFANEFHMNEHKHEVHSLEDSVMYQCVICDNLFDSEVSLDEHVNDLHRTPSPLEPTGTMATAAEDEELLLLASPSTIEAFDRLFMQCDMCHELFMDESHLQDHVRSMHSNVFKCQECNDSFVDDVGLERHISKVHLTSDMEDCEDGNVKVFLQCTLCEDLYEDKLTLDTHVQADHPFE